MLFDLHSVSAETARPLTTLRGRLTLAFAVMATLFLLAIAASDRGLRRVDAKMRDVLDATGSRQLASQQLGAAVGRMSDRLVLAETANDPATLAAQRSAYEDDARIVSLGLVSLEGEAREFEIASEVLDRGADTFRLLAEELRLREGVREQFDKTSLVLVDLVDELEGEAILAEHRGADPAPVLTLRAATLLLQASLRKVDDAFESGAEDNGAGRFGLEVRRVVRALGGVEPELRTSAGARLYSVFDQVSGESGLVSRGRDVQQSAAAFDVLISRVRALHAELAATSVDVSERALAYAFDARATATEAAQSARFAAWAYWVAALIVSALILTFYVNGRLVRRLEQLIVDVRRLSEGDLGVEVRRGGDREVAQLADAAEVFRRNALDLANAVSDVEQRNAALSEFAHVASHDLKTPMRSIALLADWVREDCADTLTAESTQHLELMRDRIERMESLLEDLLRYSRLGNDERIFESFALFETMHGVLDMLDLPDSAEVQVLGVDAVIQSVRAPFAIVMRNLVQNAVKHHDRELQRIDVTFGKARGGMIEIYVDDDGPGIDPARRDEAFRMFRSLAPEGKGTGTGMGLALVRRAATMMGGSIEIESRGERGTRMRLLWPVSAQASAEATRHGTASKQAVGVGA